MLLVLSCLSTTFPKKLGTWTEKKQLTKKKHPVGFDLGGLRWCVVASHFASSDLHLRRKVVEKRGFLPGTHGLVVEKRGSGPSPIAKVPSGFRTSLAALSSTAAMAP